MILQIFTLCRSFVLQILNSKYNNLKGLAKKKKKIILKPKQCHYQDSML